MTSLEKGYQLRKTFWTPYEQMKRYEGRKFQLICKVEEPEEIDEELKGQLFVIEFDDGTQIQAWFEEIYDKSCLVNGVLI